MTSAIIELVLALALLVVYVVIVLTGHSDQMGVVAAWVGIALNVILGTIITSRLSTKVQEARNGNGPQPPEVKQ